MIILVVEDDGLIGLMASDELQRAGYEVVSAFNADEAISVLEGRSDIHLLFTDVEMPGSMNGLRLAAAARDRWPPINIVITSGKSKPPDNLMPKGSAFLAKPYPACELIRAVQSFP